jgi:hypothetical protein
MKNLKRYNNEKGFALILALSMLVILSLLGVFALMTSTTEVQISGNYSAAQQALSAADRTLEVGEALITNVGSIDMDEEKSDLIDLLRVGIWGPVKGAGNQVVFLRSGPAAGFGADFKGNYYAVTAVGGADSGNPGASKVRTRLESQNINVSFAGGSSSTQFTTTNPNYSPETDNETETNYEE